MVMDVCVQNIYISENLSTLSPCTHNIYNDQLHCIHNNIIHTRLEIPPSAAGDQWLQGMFTETTMFKNNVQV